MTAVLSAVRAACLKFLVCREKRQWSSVFAGEIDNEFSKVKSFLRCNTLLQKFGAMEIAPKIPYKEASATTIGFLRLGQCFSP